MILTNAQFLSLFGKPSTEARWIDSATRLEYLGIMIYVVQRSQGKVPK